MPEFAIIRLGKDSVSDMKSINSLRASPGNPVQIKITCKQVPGDVGAGDYVFVVLGSDNDKGVQTEWERGLRAIGQINNKTGGPGYNDNWYIEVSIGVIFSHSASKSDLLATAPAAYFWCANMPVIGLDSFSNQTVQRIKVDDDKQSIGALIYAITKFDAHVYSDIMSLYPGLSDYLSYIPPTPFTQQSNKAGQVPKISDNDPYYEKFKKLQSKGKKLFLLTGAPGTGKTHYARQIVEKLTGGNEDRSVYIQLHPSFSYDDFVEGYVPTGKIGSDNNEPVFSLKDKVFLMFCERARNNQDKEYYLVIDELSRGDVSRVFGELLTYLEEGYREIRFTLSYSNREISIPKNITVIGTVNPFDKSVSDIDMAFDRRFSKISFDPEEKVLDAILVENGVDSEIRSRVLSFFQRAQEQLPFGGLGHAFFKDVKDASDLTELWEHELQFFFKKAFQFDMDTYVLMKEQYDAILSPEVGDDETNT